MHPWLDGCAYTVSGGVVILCVGRVMTDYLMAQENVGCGAIRECQWRPRHNKLSNEFKCYTNYASTRLNLEGSDASPNA